MNRPLGVILAGGRNRRFGGRPKALERIGGRRIVDRAADALAPHCAQVVMVANDATTYAAVDLPQRPDVLAEGGALAGVHTALTWARELHAPGALVIACDMPFVPAALMAELWRSAQGLDGALPESDGPRGVEPLCAAYGTSCLPAIERAIERADLRIIAFHDEVRLARLPRARVRQLGDPARMFFNVNSAPELERALTLARES